MISELQDALDKFHVLNVLLAGARERAVADKTDKYLRTIGLAVGTHGERSERINTYFDDISRQQQKLAWVQVVSTFEAIVFSRLPQAVAEMKRTLESHYPNNAHFYRFASRFVRSKDEIHDLSGVRRLLEGKISVRDFDLLKEIVGYRNHIAHGERLDAVSQLSVEQAASVLDRILASI